MARQQHLFSGQGRWIGASGNAAFVLLNRNGSGKTIYLNDLSIRNVTPLWTQPPSAVAARFVLAQATGCVGGVKVMPVGRDTNAALPSQIELIAGGAATQGVVYNSNMFVKGVLNTGLADLKSPKASGLKRGSGVLRGKLPTNEMVTVRSGESVACFPSFVQHGQYIRTTIDFVMHSVPKRTFTASFMAELSNVNNTLFQLKNGIGSGVNVSIIDVMFEEVGTYDTPYFQLVPIGGLDASFLDDAQARFATQPMDSAYGSLDPAKVACLSDVPILPLGVPAQYFAEGSVGTPKGVSYLQTKDFLGPVYRVFFPEYRTINMSGGRVDDCGLTFAPKRGGLGLDRSRITIREGEGVAIVSSAETALNVAIVAVSGWGVFDISGRITVEPSSIPSVTISGVKPGSDVVILQAGTTNVLATGNAIAGAEYLYQSDEPAVIDIGILQNGYVPLYIRNFNLNQAGAVIPVSQVADRNFA
jgi:hypothetical protein